MNSSNQSETPEILSVAEIFAENIYQVPLYQRAYAWTDTEINVLLADVRDARVKQCEAALKGEPVDYYIGSLVVNTVRTHEHEYFEVVDGQQRLTTLFLILAIVPRLLTPSELGMVGQLEGKLTYEGRGAAVDDLRHLARDGISAVGSLETSGIINAAELIASRVRAQPIGNFDGANEIQASADNGFTAADMDYLLNHVKILRTKLPDGTDLNHYFEVMNTRGEQLEKHEILKANLTSVLGSEAERQVFSRIWDACGVLDRHLQAQFSAQKHNSLDDQSERDAIFGTNWDGFLPSDSAGLFGLLGAFPGDPEAESARVDEKEMTQANPTTGVSTQRQLPLTELLLNGGDFEKSEPRVDSTAGSGRYGMITDFPNLLLHTLKIHQGESFSWAKRDAETASPVRLEDKYLLEEFRRAAKAIRLAGDGVALATWVREFAFRLLKTRYLLDNYVIRTKNTNGDDEENWVIERAVKYVDASQKKIQLNTESTFRGQQSVSKTGEINAELPADDEPVPLPRQGLMLQAMFQVSDPRRSSKYYLFQILKWLNHQEEPSRIDHWRFVLCLESMAHDRLRTLDFHKWLKDGTHTPNFLFNVLDYELWKLGMEHSSELARKLLGSDAAGVLETCAKDFRFGYRDSVEHFYPQNPLVDQGHLQLDPSIGDGLGNLCIMTRSENSRRNNLMPIAKAREFRSTGQSIKFQLMAHLALEKNEWDRTEITDHEEAVVGVLEHALEN